MREIRSRIEIRLRLILRNLLKKVDQNFEYFSVIGKIIITNNESEGNLNAKL